MRVVHVEWKVTSNHEPRQIEGTIDGLELFVHFRRNWLDIDILLVLPTANPRKQKSSLQIETPCFLWESELKQIVKDALRVWAFAYYGERCKLEVRTKKRDSHA